jgi:hypothetical protein
MGQSEPARYPTATVSCDHAGPDAGVRAFQRAVISGTEPRLVVTAPIVSRVLSLSGMDQLVPIHPSLEAARAASPHRAGRASLRQMMERPFFRGDTVG